MADSLSGALVTAQGGGDGSLSWLLDIGGLLGDQGDTALLSGMGNTDGLGIPFNQQSHPSIALPAQISMRPFFFKQGENKSLPSR